MENKSESEIRDRLKKIQGYRLGVLDGYCEGVGVGAIVGAGVGFALAIPIMFGIEQGYSQRIREAQQEGFERGSSDATTLMAENGVTAAIDIDVTNKIFLLRQISYFGDTSARTGIANELKRDIAHIIGCKLKEFASDDFIKNADDLIIKPGSIELKRPGDNGNITVWNRNDNPNAGMQELTENYDKFTNALDRFVDCTDEETYKKSATTAAEHAEAIQNFSRISYIIPDPNDATNLIVISSDALQEMISDAYKQHQDDTRILGKARERFEATQQIEKAVQEEIIAEQGKGIEGFTESQDNSSEPTMN